MIPPRSASCRSIVTRSTPDRARKTRLEPATDSGSIVNIPVRIRHAPVSSTTPPFARAWRRLADRIRPELVLISAGFDAHAEDPVGDLGLEIEDFEVLTKAIVSVAETHAAGRIVSVLEGGYNVPILAGSVAAHLQALGAELPSA